MDWSDEGVVLAARRHGERALIVEALTAQHGRHAGLLRGGQSPKTRASWQIGNRLQLHWRARLEDHLGSFSGELVAAHAATLLDDRARLAALASAAALASSALPEREPHPRAYQGLLHLIAALTAESGATTDWAALYVAWEMTLLEELGFGLDLSCCAATGVTEDLVYVSPRSGQAVSREAGVPYREKLLPLPAFLRRDASNGGQGGLGEGLAASSEDILGGLRLAGFFLEARVFTPHQQRIPAARGRLVDVLRQILAIPGP